jgi:urease accessory protein
MILVEQLPSTGPPPGSTADLLVLTWEQRGKTRQRLTTQAGRAIGIKLPTGARLPPGTVIYIGEGFHVQVAAADEDVWLIRSTDAPTFARLAYEIGNRHFPIEIGADRVAVLYDHTLGELWERLGVRAERVRRPFLSEQRPSAPHR